MMWGSSGETPFDVAVSDQHLQLWQVASICDPGFGEIDQSAAVRCEMLLCRSVEVVLVRVSRSPRHRTKTHMDVDSSGKYQLFNFW
jgi:hypothetical protein